VVDVLRTWFAGAVVTWRTVLLADSLPAASKALTRYLYRVEGVRLLSVNEGVGLVATAAPFLKMR
jgi:hypothetical protein